MRFGAVGFRGLGVYRVYRVYRGVWVQGFRVQDSDLGV